MGTTILEQNFRISAYFGLAKMLAESRIICRASAQKVKATAI